MFYNSFYEALPWIDMNSAVLPPLSLLSKAVIIGGLYEHYKGLRYIVIAVARHSETLEELIVYQALYDEEAIWVRPLTMFLEDIEIDGQVQPRFELIK